MRYSSSSRKRLQYVHICLLVSISRFYGTWNSIKPPSAIGTHRISWEEWRPLVVVVRIRYYISKARFDGPERRRRGLASQRSRSYRHNVSRRGMNISRPRSPRVAVLSRSEPSDFTRPAAAIGEIEFALLKTRAASCLKVERPIVIICRVPSRDSRASHDWTRIDSHDIRNPIKTYAQDC